MLENVVKNEKVIPWSKKINRKQFRKISIASMTMF